MSMNQKLKLPYSFY